MQSTAQTLDFQLVNPANGGGNSLIVNQLAHYFNISHTYSPSVSRGQDALGERMGYFTNTALLVGITLHCWSHQHCTDGLTNIALLVAGKMGHSFN